MKREEKAKANDEKKKNEKRRKKEFAFSKQINNRLCFKDTEEDVTTSPF